MTDWSKLDLQKLCDALAMIIGEREGVNIRIKLEKKPPEMLEEKEA